MIIYDYVTHFGRNIYKKKGYKLESRVKKFTIFLKVLNNSLFFVSEVYVKNSFRYVKLKLFYS